MRTKQVLKTVLLSEMTLSSFGFVTCLQNHISLSDECDNPLSTSECFWLRLYRQSFYHYRKRQLVPTDRYRFRSIGKLIGSVSHDRVAYRYLDAFPKNKECFWAPTIVDSTASQYTITVFLKAPTWVLNKALRFRKCQST